MNSKERSLKELAFYLGDHLAKNGIQTVLTGGACVTIYAANKYLSYDLDFVPLIDIPSRTIEDALAQIGFRREGRIYKHPEIQFIVDILPPPPAVGSEPVKEIKELRSKGLVLRLLSPTDCVKDRLAAFYHWKDLQALQQAVLVARDQKVDLDEVQRWSTAEGMDEGFLEFRKRLHKRSKEEK